MKKVIGWLLVCLIISGCASMQVKEALPESLQKIKALALAGKVDPNNPDRMINVWTNEDSAYMVGYDKSNGEIAVGERSIDNGMVRIVLMTYTESTKAYLLRTRDSYGDGQKVLTTEQGLKLASLFLADLKGIGVKTTPGL